MNTILQDETLHYQGPHSLWKQLEFVTSPNFNGLRTFKLLSKFYFIQGTAVENILQHRVC